MTEKTKTTKAKATKTTKETKKTKSLVGTHGRTFEGTIVKKFPHRVVVEFERTVYVKKYQRFYVKQTRLHARLPKEIQVEEGDLIKVRRCRPLSKIIHFIVLGKVVRSKEAKK